MDASRILLDLLIVLVAAKLASEGSERLGIPAVVGEILAGIIIGPSLLHLVGGGDEVLRVLGEIGVILLLLDVGLEMDLRELRKVGATSLSVATIGVIAPMAMGYGAMIAMGETSNTALFVGAALTATSVGITARVFGDLRALATSEARIVLGAAVADDVMGLVVLTVVVRLVTEGSVSVVSVAGIVLLAVAFLVIGGAAGLRITPWLFRHIDRLARSRSTLVALAFAFALAFSELADQARLAPIVGAFLAGLALGGTDSSERIRADLAPLGHVFIPVFFLQIGIDADIAAFGRGTVLLDAGLLLIVAVVGKLVAASGVRGGGADRLLVGLGMLPRGEVGLIFATIGLANGVLGDDLYAALLLVVLVSTLMTPPLLKARSRTVLGRARAALRAREGDVVDPVPSVVDGEIVLPGAVDDDHALELALRAALMARSAAASTDLVTWLGGVAEDAATGWSAEERELLLDVVERGNARSWRFLEATGTLDRALPELAAALRRRRNDPLDLDGDGPYRWRALERLRMLDPGNPLSDEARRLEHPVALLMAALFVEALDAEPDPIATARAIADRIGLDRVAVDEALALVADRHLLWAATRRTGALTEDNVLALAAHLGTPDRARATYVLAALRDEGHETWERLRLRELHGLVMEVLEHEAPDEATRNLLDARRARLAELLADDEVAEARTRTAPASFLLAFVPDQLARIIRQVDPLPRRGVLRVTVTVLAVEGEGRWQVVVASRDRVGILAAAAASLAAAGLDIDRADVATWTDGAALEVFAVAGAAEPDAAALAADIERRLEAGIEGRPVPDAQVRFDDRASPWHTVAEIDAPERHGLLADLAAAFRAAGVTVRAASISGHDGRAYDTFELVTTAGRKLDPDAEEAVRDFVARGAVQQRRRLGRTRFVPAPA